MIYVYCGVQIVSEHLKSLKLANSNNLLSRRSVTSQNYTSWRCLLTFCLPSSSGKQSPIHPGRVKLSGVDSTGNTVDCES